MIETYGPTAAAVAAAQLADSVVAPAVQRTRREPGSFRAAGPITSQGTSAPVATPMSEVGNGADVRFAAPSGSPARSLLV